MTFLLHEIQSQCTSALRRGRVLSMSATIPGTEHDSMGRFILHFIFAAVSAIALKIVLYPEKDLWMQIGIMVAGFVCIFILGFEVFLHFIAPTEGEFRGIAELIRRDPRWKRRQVVLGWISGLIAAIVFFVVGSKTDDIWVAGIPVAVFFVFAFTLQYIVPRLLLSQAPEPKKDEQDAAGKSQR